MARYWLPIIIVLVIVSSLGTHYVRGTASHLPEFVLVPQQGDVAEVQDVFIRGYYDLAQRSPTVDIQLDGSKYSIEQTLAESLDPYYWSDVSIRQLAKEKRQFMRGKRGELSFFQNDQLVVYVGQDERKSQGVWKKWFQVSILNKSNNETTSYEVTSTALDPYNYWYIEDVQVFGDELVIFVSGRNSAYGREYQRYQIGLMNGELRNEEVLTLPQGEDTDVWLVQESDPTRASQYAAFLKSGEKDELIQYDILAGTWEELQSPEVHEFFESQLQFESNFLSVVRDGHMLYGMNYGPQGMYMLEYDLAELQGTLRHIDTKHLTHVQVRGDRMYMLAKEEAASSWTLDIMSLSGGELLFRGSIEVRNSQEQSGDLLKPLELYEVQFLR